jgi:hypothetical protein
MKCVECDRPKAKFKCRKCGVWYCHYCADSRDRVCACQPATIERVKGNKDE